MKFNKERLRTPGFIFFAYVAAGSLLILGFRFIFPGETAPLPIFSRNWRLILALIEIIALFPALAFSALVIPFGIPDEDEDAYTRFSPSLFQRMTSPIVTAIFAAVMYVLLSFLVLPLAKNAEGNMRFQGELYRMAKEQAQVNVRAKEWIDASQFIGICDSVWENSPELVDLRAEIEIHLAESNPRVDPVQDANGAALLIPPGLREPVDVLEAMSLGETALDEGRFLDAHWLATLGGRLAREGSPEAASASRLAARAWNQIENQQPTPFETRAFSLYRLKLSGYQAMVSGDWIRAFYLFQELADLSPNDPDAENFLAVSERGTKEIAFFMDEIEVSPGEAHTGVIFSLPGHGGGQGRSVMRVASLSNFPDLAYGTGIEYMGFDSNARLLYRLQAPYAKFLPITLDGQRQVLIMMRALDRYDSAKRWEPEWEILENSTEYHGEAQITLNISYEAFLMLPQMRQGLPSLQIGELFAAQEIALETGYIPQVFETEILNRLGSCIFFLPMAIVTIVIGWRFRARQRPRYLFIPLLPVLPVVFNGLAYLYRSILSIVGASLILALGFSTALILFIVILVLSFLLSLILLASQHG